MIPDNSKMIEKFQSINEIKIWCWINPKSANSVQDLALLAHKKVFGLKIHMFWHKLTIEDLRKFMSQYVIKLDKPIYLILDWVDSQELETFLKEYSTYTWILGYGGFPITKNGIEIISKLDNIYIDISSFHLSIKWLKTIRAKVDPRKILYSTDFPYNFNLVGEEFSYKLFEERLIKSGIEVNAIRLNSYRMVKGVN
jgi:predicted TIM-barrel fold metal-dependent hydrolase